VDISAERYAIKESVIGKEELKVVEKSVGRKETLVSILVWRFVIQEGSVRKISAKLK